MCGLAGIEWNDRINTDILYSTIQKLSHRGHDMAGIYFDKKIGLCHTRLSILDLSPAACQPFTDERGDFILLFNGDKPSLIECADLIISLAASLEIEQNNYSKTPYINSRNIGYLAIHFGQLNSCNLL